jgi:hypothetical protein
MIPMTKGIPMIIVILPLQIPTFKWRRFTVPPQHCRQCIIVNSSLQWLVALLLLIVLALHYQLTVFCCPLSAYNKLRAEPLHHLLALLL